MNDKTVTSRPKPNTGSQDLKTGPRSFCPRDQNQIPVVKISRQDQDLFVLETKACHEDYIAACSTRKWKHKQNKSNKHKQF